MAGCMFVSTAREQISANHIIARGDDEGYQQTRTIDNTSQLVNLYLYRVDATPSLTSTVSPGDTTISINSNAGISNGDAVTLYEDDHLSQNVVKSTTAVSMTLQAPIDKAFTVGATVNTGAWSMDVNGSVTPHQFTIKPPPNGCLHLSSIGFSMLDSSDMDSGKFGGITQLPNGLLLYRENSERDNLLLVVNNMGFCEQGYEMTYDDKAPAGQYGVRFRLDLLSRAATSIRLDGTIGDYLVVLIQDELSDLDLLTCTVMGHVCDL